VLLLAKLLTRRVIKVGGSLGITLPSYLLKNRSVVVISVYEDDEIRRMINEGVV